MKKVKLLSIEPDKQWKLYKLHLLFYYYCSQMEMPFEDINTKREIIPASGLLSDQTEIFTVLSERL